MTLARRGRILVILAAPLPWPPPARPADLPAAPVPTTAGRAGLRPIEAGTPSGRNADGRDVLLSRSDYGGLLGRSRHSGTLRLTGRLPGSGFNASARLIWRGRYGDRDVNGNVVLDDDREYVNGYALLNLTLSQTIQDATLQAGVRNLLDFKRPEQLPTQPGRTVFGGFSYRF